MVFVLVTGATGFVGSHVVDQLLDAGHKVRGTARPSKADRLKAAYNSYGDRFDVAIVEDFTTSDLTAAFNGTEALIHVASPLAGGAPDVVLKGAVDGTNRVLDFAAKAGTIKKIIVTSSVASLIHFDAAWDNRVFGDKDWNPQTYEDAIKPGLHPLSVYFTSKKLSELAVRQFAQEHPDIEISTVHPPYIYGPTGRGQVLDAPAEGTNSFVYSLFQTPAGSPRKSLPDPNSMVTPIYNHVSDVARAHVLLLSPPSGSPLCQPGEVKRVVLKSGDMRWVDAVEYLSKTRPELKERLVVIPEGFDHPEEWARFSGESAERWIGIKEGDYKGWKETLDGTVDDILEREKKLGVVTAL